MATPVELFPRAKASTRFGRDQILRFEACERHLHWCIAAPFTICYLTALVLVAVYNPDPTRPYRIVFAWIHRLSGLALTLLPPLVLFIHRREFRQHLGNIREALSWGTSELLWLLLMGPSMLSRRVKLPHQGKFNAAEKINFLMVMSTYPLYIATGLTIWLLRPAYVSWMIHIAMAMAATPLILGHVFMATVNPDTRVGLSGMISGWVSREWARHHYRRWYDQKYGPFERPAHHEPVPAPVEVPVSRRAPVPASAPAVGVRAAMSGLAAAAAKNPVLSGQPAPTHTAREWA